MAIMAAKIVANYLEKKGTTPQVLQEDLITTGWSFKDGSVRIFFQFHDDNTHVHLEGIDFIKVPKEKHDDMYRVVNKVNDKFNLVKFVLDEENDQICVRNDAIIQLDSCGEECFELMIRTVQIVEEAYPLFMKSMWG